MKLNNNFAYGSIIAVIVFTLLYHISQKSTPTNINPLFSLIVTYCNCQVKSDPFFI
jgi:hypothetical protein